MSWWRRLRLRDRADDELDAELRDHVERQVADYVRAGMSAREARRRARLEFGGLDHVKEMCRDVRRTRWVEDLAREVRYALRRQFKDRGSRVSVFAVVALAMGVGASTAMFGVLDAVVLQPLPFAQEERLVAGWKTSRTDTTRFIELSYPEFLEWRAQSKSFESLAALPTTVYGYSYVLTGRRDPVAIESTRVTAEFFDVLGVRPLLGRTLAATDDREGAQPIVVLTHAFWTNVLGADPEAVSAWAHRPATSCASSLPRAWSSRRWAPWIGLAVAILDTVIALAPDGIARIGSASIDGWSLVFAAACLVVVTLGIGCVPLMMVRDTSINALLRGSAAGVGGSTHAARIGGALLTVEVIGTVALLIIAAALTVSFFNLRGADLGFDREGVLTAFVNPSRVRYPDAAARRRFFRDVIARLETNAEVEAAGAALLRPLEGVIGWDLPYRLPGQSPEDAAGNSILNLEVVTPTYFEAIGTPLLAGRGFAETDGLYVARAEPDPAAPLAMESAAERQPPAAVESAVERQPLVAIVSESVAREMYGFPPDAVGRRFVGGRNAPRSYRIVGVVADGRYRRVREVSGDVFLPYTQTAIPLRYVVVRTSAGPAAARAILRRALAEVDPEQPMSADLTTTELVERALSRERFQSALLLPFGLGSALLAAIGVFGTVTDTANRRLRELALRLALGASRSRVLVRLVRSTVTCILLGSCVGILLAIAADRTLNLALFETALADPWIIVAVCSVVLGVALVACVGPAMRVLRLDVGAVLRQ